MKESDIIRKHRERVEREIWLKKDRERVEKKLRVAQERMAWEAERRKQEMEARILQADIERRLLVKRMADAEARQAREKIKKEAIARINEAASEYESLEEAMDILEEITKISS